MAVGEVGWHSGLAVSCCCSYGCSVGTMDVMDANLGYPSLYAYTEWTTVT